MASKIIHTSNLELFKPFKEPAIKFVQVLKEKGRMENFIEMLEYARKNAVSVILLTGDLYGVETPTPKQKEDVYKVISEYSDLDFIYLRGQQDQGIDSQNNPPENLHYFYSNLYAYHFGGVRIVGLESKNYERLKELEKSDEVTIACLYPFNDLDEELIKSLPIDYLALGGKIEREVISYGHFDAVYPGESETSLYSEPSYQGFELLEIEGNSLKHTHIPFTTYPMLDKLIDASTFETVEDYIEVIKPYLKLKNHGIYRFRCKGLKLGLKTAAGTELFDAVYNRFVDEERVMFITLIDETEVDRKFAKKAPEPSEEVILALARAMFEQKRREMKEKEARGEGH